MLVAVAIALRKAEQTSEKRQFNQIYHGCTELKLSGNNAVINPGMLHVLNKQVMMKKNEWYLIYTRSKHERKVATFLDWKNIKSFLPLNQVLKQWHDRKKLIEEPLFPSYLFVYLQTVDDYYECLNCEGVFTFVKTGNEVVTIKQSLIDQLQILVNNVQNIKVSGSQFIPGQMVTIIDGPLAGVSGKIITANKKNSIIVNIEMLDRSLTVDLDQCQVTSFKEQQVLTI